MKHTRFLFVALTALALIACSKKDEPTYTPGGGGGGSTVSINFTYNRISPTMVEFTNTSTGCSDFRWDFGDGTWSNGKNATHGYDALGTYTVTLTGTVNGTKYDKAQKITLTKPEIWITGYTIYKIPYENKYYRFYYKDDALLPSDWDCFSRFTPLLTNSDLPYTYKYQNPIMLENPYSHDYWTIQLVRANSTADGSAETSCLKAKLRLSDITGSYNSEYTFRSDAGTTAFGVLLGYEY